MLSSATPNSSSNLDPKIRGLILKSQCYDRALDLAELVPYDALFSSEGAFAVADSLHKIDLLTALTDALLSNMDLVYRVWWKNELNLISL